MAARAMIDLGHGRPAKAVAMLAAAAVAASLAAALFYGRQPDRPGFVRMPDAPPLAYRDLRFTDGDDGTVSVSDARDGVRIVTYRPGEGAFVRVTLRGLAQERLRAGGGEATPFRVARQADGKLTVEDPVTRRVILIDAFGPTQVEAFTQLLPKGE